MYEKFLDKFMPSKDMREYLKNENLNVYDMARIIYGSPCPVDEKLVALNECYESFTDGSDEYTLCSIKGMIECIEKALQIKDEEGIYLLEMCVYDDLIRYHTDRSLKSLYCKYDEAISFINNIDDGISSGYLIWFEITKWKKENSGKLYEECKYYYVKKELQYINLLHPIDGFSEEMIGGGDLYLPVPFKAGDIVHIDGCNFAPGFPAVILDVGDNSDCCSLQALARDSDSKWISGAVKHGMVGSYHDPCPSMLYTIEKYNGFLERYDEILIDISNFIKKGSDNVREFVDKIKHRGPFSDNELIALMCKLQ